MSTYLTKMSAFLLSLSLCLPAPVWALRASNAGMEEHPTRRALGAALADPIYPLRLDQTLQIKHRQMLDFVPGFEVPLTWSFRVHGAELRSNSSSAHLDVTIPPGHALVYGNGLGKQNTLKHLTVVSQMATARFEADIKLAQEGKDPYLGRRPEQASIFKENGTTQIRRARLYLFTVKQLNEFIGAGAPVNSLAEFSKQYIELVQVRPHGIGPVLRFMDLDQSYEAPVILQPGSRRQGAGAEETLVQKMARQVRERNGFAYVDWTQENAGYLPEQWIQPAWLAEYAAQLNEAGPITKFNIQEVNPDIVAMLERFRELKPEEPLGLAVGKLQTIEGLVTQTDMENRIVTAPVSTAIEISEFLQRQGLQEDVLVGAKVRDWQEVQEASDAGIRMIEVELAVAPGIPLGSTMNLLERIADYADEMGFLAWGSAGGITADTFRYLRKRGYIGVSVGPNGLKKLSWFQSSGMEEQLLLFRQEGVVLPPNLKNLSWKDLPADFDAAAALLRTSNQVDGKGALALVLVRLEDQAQWNDLFQAHGITAIQMTPKTTATLQGLNPEEAGFFLEQLMGHETGLVLETGIEESASGQLQINLSM